MPSLTAAAIAAHVGGQVDGQPEAVLTGLSGLREAEPGQLSFVANPRYAAHAETTRATAIIVPLDWKRPCPATLIRAKHPEQAFAQAAALFAPPPVAVPRGVHPTAVVAPDAVLGRDVAVGPHCVIESGVRVGDRCTFVAGCYVGQDSTIGSDGWFHPHVTMRERTRIGDRCIIHNGTVLSSDGFGYVQEGVARKKIPQLGTVWIGDDVELGANVTVDRARFGQTRIGNGVKVDNLVQIAHNVLIGDHSVVIAQVGISGSSSIGERCIIAGQVGIAGHLNIGSDVVIGAQSGVSKDLPPRSFWLGSPVQQNHDFAKSHAHVMSLPKWKEKVATLEKRVADLEQRLGVQTGS